MKEYENVKVYAGSSSEDLAKRIVKYLGKELSPLKFIRFADGEIFKKPEESVRDCKVFVIHSTSEKVNENLMELLIFIDALKRASASEIVAVIPYYGYARQDRIASNREPITAKLVANLLTAAGATRVITMDLHTPQLQGFFDIPVDHMEAAPIFAKYFVKQGFDPDETVIVSPNVGGLKRSRGLADRFNTSLAIIDKREEPDGSQTVGIIGDVEGKTAILMDDLINTGATMEIAAKALLDNGAIEVYGCGTHGIFSENAVERLEKSHLKEVIITDSIAQPEHKKFSKLKILSTSRIFAETIKRVYTGESISDLFEI